MYVLVKSILAVPSNRDIRPVFCHFAILFEYKRKKTQKCDSFIREFSNFII